MDLPEPDPIAADARRTRRRALIPEHAACILCSEVDPATLEDDHVLGWRAADDVRIWLCRNCHAKQTAVRHEHQGGTPAGRHHPDLSLLEVLARALRSLGVFLAALAHALVAYAEQLLAVAVGLDDVAPGWRLEVWAR